MPINAWMQRNLFDSAQRFNNAGLACYYRIKRIDDGSAPYQELGFQSNEAPTGTFDLLIDPPPDVMPMRGRSIGIEVSQLQFAPKRFLISHTFVQKQMQINGYLDPYLVWRDPKVVGLWYGDRLYSIDSVQDIADAGEIISWEVSGAGHEVKVTATI